jgi:hypothetical protein
MRRPRGLCFVLSALGFVLCAYRESIKYSLQDTKRTKLKVRSTKFKAQSTKHQVQSSKYKAPSSKSSRRRRGWRQIGKHDPVKRFPIISWNHLDCIPRATIQKRSIGSFAGALLTADTEVWIYFDSSERRMIFIRHPEHTRLNGTILNACW